MAKNIVQLTLSLIEEEGEIYNQLKEKYYRDESDHSLMLESMRMNLLVKHLLTKHLDDLFSIYGTISFEEMISKVIQDRVLIRKKWNQRKKLIKSS